MPTTYDLLIIGGGIHGAATAALASANGLKVILVEQHDIASGTSSASSKLIHGGLRYLEQGAISLVHEAIQSRQTLFTLAPHLVKPLAFVLPINNFSRPKWKLRLGLACYDFFSRGETFPHSRFISSTLEPHYFSILKPNIQSAALYFDAQTEDSRLTIENALQAKQYGAEIKTYTTLKSAEYADNLWRAALLSNENQTSFIHAKAIVNVAGPWVNDIHKKIGISDYPNVRWVKGSHIVVPTLYPGKHAYLLQNQDGRVVFCLPYHGHTLIGTTDENLSELPSSVQISQEEIDYLFAVVQQYFKTSLRFEDIRGHWSGVRTLIDAPRKKPQTLSRDSVIHIDKNQALSTLYGGKLTTHRLTAQKLLKPLKRLFPSLELKKLQNTALPGAVTKKNISYQTSIQSLKKDFHWVPPMLLERYIQTYGTRVALLLQGCHKLEDLGQLIIPQLYEKELSFLCEEEWAKTAEDVLWRRTKLGLTTNSIDMQRLQSEMLSTISESF